MTILQPLRYLPIAAAVLAIGAIPARADNRSSTIKEPAYVPERDSRDMAADNTARNRDDRMPSAQDQSSEREHRELTAKIREQITERDDLSSYARNVKIITDQTGQVWLRGPVRSQEERDHIGQIAQRNAGNAKVHNDLDVVPKS